MKKALLFVIVLIAVIVTYQLFLKPVSIAEKPMVSEVETMLRDFLLARNRSKCSGEVSLGYLRNVEIGDYDKGLMGGNEGGWPVYASYEVNCKEGSVVTSDKDLNDATDKVAVTFMRRTRAGRVEFFQPKVVADFGKMLETSF